MISPTIVWNLGTNPLGFEPDPPQDTLPREEDTHSDDDEANAHVLLDDIAKTHVLMKRTTRIEDNFHPIFS